jgi:hypothetical protein
LRKKKLMEKIYNSCHILRGNLKKRKKKSPFLDSEFI